MRADKFTASLVFAAVAGLAAIAYVLVVLPVLGSSLGLAVGSVLGAAAYIFAVSPSLGRGLRYGSLTLGAGVALMLIAPPTVVLFCSAMLLGLIRSGVAYRASVGRALLIESVLFIVAVGTVELLAGTSVVSYGLAVWGFFLVESAFFLFAGSTPREPTPTEDPFERARREASRLIEELPS
jgi:MFS family permease